MTGDLKMRRLIICNDGTWNSPDDEDRGKIKPTNITKISRAIKPIDKKDVSQIVFYDEGVGTGFGEKVLGGITGFGLSKNIMDSYRFLSHNYQEGDEICIYGFSRGAFTSRSLVGLINCVGLVSKDDVFYLTKLFDLYKSVASKEEVDDFYQAKGITKYNPRIKLLGVFDTVGALGIPLRRINNTLADLDLMDYQFHDVSLAPIVDYAYHALAIDEQRVPFQPTLWKEKPSETHDMEQRWFAGVHSNIGGGYNPDDYANLALSYMVDKSKSIGIDFDDNYLGFFGWDLNREIRDSMSFKYRLLGKRSRKITLNDKSNQVVDESVYEKAKLSGYSPSNLPQDS